MESLSHLFEQHFGTAPDSVEPLNADRSQLKFGHKLQERWKDAGLLWLEEIYSEPIMMDVKIASYKPHTP